MVPLGLTDEEVRICVSLHPLRKSQRDRKDQRAMDKVKDETPEVQFLHMLRNAEMQILLPEELRPDRVMTRERFRCGILKFLQQVHR
jgi:hypothetical protein